MQGTCSGRGGRGTGGSWEGWGGREGRGEWRCLNSIWWCNDKSKEKGLEGKGAYARLLTRKLRRQTQKCGKTRWKARGASKSQRQLSYSCRGKFIVHCIFVIETRSDINVMSVGDDSTPQVVAIGRGSMGLLRAKEKCNWNTAVYCPVVHWNTWTGISEETNSGNSQGNDRNLRW